MKTAIIIALLLATTACSHQTRMGYWTRANTSEAQKDRDVKECDLEKAKYTPYMGAGIAGGIAEGSRSSDIWLACMRARGYLHWTDRA